MRAPWLGSKGNSILEVLMAMIVTGIAATAATSGVVATTNLLGENARYHDAMVLGQGSLERMRTISYEEIISGTSTAAGGYTITKTVIDEYPEVGMKQITVTVTWTWKGEPRTFALRTVFGELTKG